MLLPPAITIHGLDDANTALRPGRPVLLLSAPGAALFAGCGWWRAVITKAAIDTRAAPLDALDCADAPGRALEALAIGCRIIVLEPCPAWPSVADRAARAGATLLQARPKSLDLATRGAQRHVAAWLGFG